MKYIRVHFCCNTGITDLSDICRKFYGQFNSLPVLLYGVEACPMLVRDKRSLEFTVTRSLMKLFQTGSATVVSDCMNFFHFLPVSYQIDIRTAKFLENFMCSENYICTIFENKADSDLKKISARCNTTSLQF